MGIHNEARINWDRTITGNYGEDSYEPSEEDNDKATLKVRTAGKVNEVKISVDSSYLSGLVQTIMGQAHLISKLLDKVKKLEEQNNG